MITTFKIFENQTNFKIGDRVVYDTGEGEAGVITDIIPSGNVLIRFDRKWSHMLHDDGDDGTSQSWWCTSNLIKPEVPSERRFTELDPYGEEKWEIDENFHYDF